MSIYSLINQNNEIYDLRNLELKGFAGYFDGLGYSNELSYIQVGDSFVLDNKKISQNSLSAEVEFLDYANYQGMVNFIEKADSLRLAYQPGAITYYRDIDIETVGNPRTQGATVKSSIEFKSKTLFYTLADEVFYIEAIESESSYDLLFDYTFNDYASTSIDINNQGHVEAELVVEINGPIVNPTLELLVNGVSMHTVAFTITLQAGEKLIYSVRDNDNYVIKVATDGTESNAVSSLSLANDNFFKLPKGNSTLVLTSDSGLDQPIKFRIISLYKGV